MTAIPGTRPSRLDTDASVGAVQHGVIRSLIIVQAVFSLVFSMTGPLISLIAENVTASTSKAGFAQAMIYCGGVLFTLPLAMLSNTRGRRVGIAAGYLAGAIGALLVVLGADLPSYPVILLGSVGIGAALAAGFQVRFAATDLAEPDRLGRSMGVLTWCSILGAVFGPSLIVVFDRIGNGRLPEFTGSYVGIAIGLAVSGVLLLLTLRPDPLLHARVITRERSTSRVRFRTALATVVRHPPARRSIVVLMIVHAAMISLMNMVSIHVHHEAGSLTAVGMIIAVHTAVMFLPGPLVGYLTDRFGPQPMLLTGLGLEVAAAVTLALAPGHDVVLVGLGLLLLGAGWSAAYLSASVLLTASTEGQTRTLAQGAADFLVQLTSAVSALLAGVIVAMWGYGGLSTGWGVVVLVLLVNVAAKSRRLSRT